MYYINGHTHLIFSSKKQNAMNPTFVSLVLVAFVTCANAAQTASYFCRYTGTTKTIELSITKDPSVTYDILQVVGSSCSFPYTAGSSVNIEVEDGAGSATGTCGATSDGSTGYTVIVRTSSCANCIIDVDEEYTITCPFSSVNTEASQSIEISGTTVTASVTAGSATEHTETVSLLVLNSDGTSFTNPVALGVDIILRTTLTIASGAYAKGVKLSDCFAEDSTGTKTVNLFDNVGCTSTGLNIIPADRGFKKNDGESSASTYTSDSPAFKAFIFTDKDNSVLFKCTAKFCYDAGAADCAKSCGTDSSRRRRRAAENTSERRVMVMLRVSTDNSTVVSVKPSGRAGLSGDECSNRSYVIGLIILGCVLVLTFVVSVGMFVILKRSRESNNHEKFTS